MTTETPQDESEDFDLPELQSAPIFALDEQLERLWAIGDELHDLDR